jgi:hypothetical protein
VRFYSDLADGSVTGDRVALEIGKQRRMLPQSQPLIEFGGMR